MSLEEIARHTKIAQRHLEAVEHGNLGMRPAFYQRAEVRALAREIGVDEQVALALFQSITAPAEVAREPRRQVLREELAQARTNIYALLPLYTVIVTVALFAWVMSGSVASEGPAKTAGASSVARVPNDPVSASSATPSRAATMVTTPTAAVAELVVTTEPSGARVTVNGIGWGLSPVTIRHLPDGDKRIRVSKDGYAAAERVLAVDRGARRALDIRLAPH